MFYLLSFLFTVYIYNKYVLPKNEKRKDLVEISDFILDWLPTIDTSLPITLLSAINIFGLLWCMFSSYRQFVTGILMITFTIIVRSICLFLCPLKPHPKHIVLHDHLIKWIGKQTTPFVNDLFFSGHLSVWLFLYHLSFHDPFWNLISIYGSISISLLLLLCKAHYVIDLFVAPFIVSTIFQMVK